MLALTSGENLLWRSRSATECFRPEKESYNDDMVLKISASIIMLSLVVGSAFSLQTNLLTFMRGVSSPHLIYSLRQCSRCFSDNVQPCRRFVLAKHTVRFASAQNDISRIISANAEVSAAYEDLALFSSAAKGLDCLRMASTARQESVAPITPTPSPSVSSSPFGAFDRGGTQEFNVLVLGAFMETKFDRRYKGSFVSSVKRIKLWDEYFSRNPWDLPGDQPTYGGRVQIDVSDATKPIIWTLITKVLNDMNVVPNFSSVFVTTRRHRKIRRNTERTRLIITLPFNPRSILTPSPSPSPENTFHVTRSTRYNARVALHQFRKMIGVFIAPVHVTSMEVSIRYVGGRIYHSSFSGQKSRFAIRLKCSFSSPVRYSALVNAVKMFRSSPGYEHVLITQMRSIRISRKQRNLVGIVVIPITRTYQKNGKVTGRTRVTVRA